MKKRFRLEGLLVILAMSLLGQGNAAGQFQHDPSGVTGSSPLDAINRLNAQAFDDASRIGSLWRHWQMRVANAHEEARHPDLRRAVLKAGCYGGRISGYLKLAARVRDEALSSLRGEQVRCRQTMDQAVMVDPGCQQVLGEAGRHVEQALRLGVGRLEETASLAGRDIKAIGFMYASMNRVGADFIFVQLDASALGMRLVLGQPVDPSDRRILAALQGVQIATMTGEPTDSQSELARGGLPTSCEGF